MKILLLGGYGSVGHLLCEALAQDPSFDITIAGRNIHSADSLVQKIIKIFPQARIQGVVMDWSAANFAEKLAAYNPELLVNTAGPFTHQNYTVAQSCVALGIHYIDTADDRAFVTNIVALNDKALEKSVCIISGAGIVSGITSAVIDEYAQQFSILREVEFGLVYGNQIELGDARIISLLTQAGESFWRLEKGNLRSVFGWQNRHRYYYGDNVGLQYHANYNIPDLALLPQRHPSLKSVTYHVGIENPFLSFFVGFLALLKRIHFISNPQRFLKLFMRIKRFFNYGGKDTVAMFAHLSGSNLRYQPLELTWTLVAESGHGAYMPIASILLLIKKIQANTITPGARPCVGLFTLEECYALLSQWRIYHIVEEKEY